MNEDEPVESAVVVRRPDAIAPLIWAHSPAELVQKAQEMATELSKVIDSRRLYSTIQGKKYVQVEGWTTLGAMVGVFPFVEWSRPIINEGGEKIGWEARCLVRRPDGAEIGAAEAQCTSLERNWADRDDYALRSMAQTRATSKAMRLPLAWIMALAGYEATPAEEMPRDEVPASVRRQQPQRTSPAVDEANPITEAQIRAIRATMHTLWGGDERAAWEWMKTREPAACELANIHLGGLTIAQASAVIRTLNEERGQRKKAAGAEPGAGQQSLGGDSP